jgi:phage gpG-like protein
MSAATERRLHGVNGKPGKRILIGQGSHGGLMDSIHYEEHADHVLVGTDKAYGAIHQMGGKVPAMTIRPSYKKALYWPGALHPVKKVNRPEITIPARPYLMVQEEDIPAMHDKLGRWLIDG